MTLVQFLVTTAAIAWLLDMSDPRPPRRARRDARRHARSHARPR